MVYRNSLLNLGLLLTRVGKQLKIIIIELNTRPIRVENIRVSSLASQ